MTIDELFPGIYMEDKEVEFKGILSKGKDDKGNSLEMDWLKTIAAFLSIEMFPVFPPGTSGHFNS